MRTGLKGLPYVMYKPVIWRPMAIEIAIVFAVGVGVGWAGHAIYASPDRYRFTDVVQKSETGDAPKKSGPLITYGDGKVTINIRRK